MSGKLRPPRSQDRALLWLMATTMAPYWRSLLAALTVMLGVAGLTVVPPYLLERAIDGPISSGDLRGVLVLAGCYAGTVLLSFGLQFVQVYLLQTSGQRALADLRRRLFEHMFGQSMDFFNNREVGDLIQHLTGDIQALNSLLSTSIVTILVQGLTLIIVVIVMYVVNWRMAIIATLVLPILAVLTPYFRRRIRRSSTAERDLNAQLSGYLNEQINGMQLVQLFNRQRVSREEFAERSWSYRLALLDQRKQSAVFLSTQEILTSLGLGLLLYWGGQGVLAGWASLGVLVAFVQYADRAFQPILRLGEQYNNVQIALASAERLANLLAVEPSIRPPEHPVDVPAITGAVAMEDVHFAYKPDEPVLRGVTLRIRPGQNIAVVGPTGAGKSSLASLLARFYDPQRGGIILDGEDIRHLHPTDLRHAVVVVPQDPVCIAGTIASNIRLYDETISDDEVRRAAEYANAAQFIEALPAGYETEVVPGGANLSLGQRQLLALARAIALSPEGVIVLDEATSSIDSETEALIQDALDRILHDRTSIVIAHRLSTIRNADRIIVMERGRVVEDGSHQELLHRGGRYASLYSHQSDMQASA